ncbi:hypothetical protein B0T10DRAFT_558756 [Thelonectria olida]|uniref:Secreted protein n=1 Tax=Thelonectria olida TaxID=1576542 RepID=A0A9P8WDA4_9HYPO|nr:hypothetical protein B0T10DRAFT_558756 [Thelonectria olida]
MKTAVIVSVLSLGTLGLALPKPDGIVLVPIDRGCWRTTNCCIDLCQCGDGNVYQMNTKWTTINLVTPVGNYLGFASGAGLLLLSVSSHSQQ